MSLLVRLMIVRIGPRYTLLVVTAIHGVRLNAFAMPSAQLTGYLRLAAIGLLRRRFLPRCRPRTAHLARSRRPPQLPALAA
jgi:hypothetical protein